MARTTFKGPVKSENGFIIGDSAVTITKIMKGTVSVNPAEISANASAETDVTISGVAAGDIVILNTPASLETGLVLSGARVKAANTVSIRLSNITGTAVNGGALDWTYTIIRMA
jgi:hypothetical protein